ncbi:UNVERIFIED_CONTAM: hypothetical protein Sindi_1698000 [Sesamum indicum]
MEGSSRRNVGEEETPRKGGPMVHITKDDLQRMIEEASRNAIVEYETRTATPMVKEIAKRQLFQTAEPRRESREQSEPEQRSKRLAISEAGSSSHIRAKKREPVIWRAEVDSVGRQIELLNKQIDELKKQGEIVSHNKSSPFGNDILIQTVEPGFRPGPIMANLFATTLTGKAQEWFSNLPRGSIESYEQLIQQFNFHFATHLFNIRQREDEPLNNFMGRFNNETLEVQELRIDMIVSILIHGLRKGPFTSALARDPPGDVEQLMALAQKYIDEEEMNAMKDSEQRECEQVSRPSYDSREGGGNKQKPEKPREPKYQPKYHNYTPLVLSREKALMMVENADVLQWPRHTRYTPSKKISNKYCRFHRERGHNTEECFQLKDEIERLVRQGNFRDRVTPNCKREESFILKVEEEEAISFDSSDRPKESGDMNDPMVIKLDIVNFIVHKVLIDSGSSTDIIFKSVVDKMGLENARLEPVKTPLVGFGGSEVASLGTIELPVSMGEAPRRKTLIVKFLVVDTPFAYNGEVTSDLREARKCYNLTLKGEPKQKKMRIKEDAEPRPYEAEHLKPSDEYKVVQLVPDEPDKTTRIGANMKEREMAMIEFLRSYVDMFAWSPLDFTGINPEVIVHRLNVDPMARPIQQRKRSFGSDKNEVIKQEVDKLLKCLSPNPPGNGAMCVDFTDLNKACPKDPYPLPRIDVMVDSTAGMFGDLLGKTMEVYVDDMLVKSRRSQEHLVPRASIQYDEEGETLFLYLGVSENAVSSVLVREEGNNQNPIYYVSKMLQGAESRYSEMEKLALALVVTARKLRPYFQSHKVVVLTNHPLKHVMSRPEASGRLIEWAVEWGQYDVDYQPRTAQKAQVLADFVIEFSSDPKSPLAAEEQISKWMLHVDGSSNANNGGAGILIQGPKGVEIEVAAEAEYEALILGVRTRLRSWNQRPGGFHRFPVNCFTN